MRLFIYFMAAILDSEHQLPKSRLGDFGLFYVLISRLFGIHLPSILYQPKLPQDMHHIRSKKNFTDFSLFTSYLRKCNSVAMATATLFYPIFHVKKYKSVIVKSGKLKIVPQRFFGTRNRLVTLSKV